TPSSDPEPIGYLCSGQTITCTIGVPICYLATDPLFAIQTYRSGYGLVASRATSNLGYLQLVCP
ncbi:9504_t:CDS:2, partial [Ambispora leptoticha]